jgi:integrase
MEEILKLYRRHVPGCKDRGKKLEHSECSCPLWCDGKLDGKRCRQSLKTADYQRALQIVNHLQHPNTERSDLIPCAHPGCSVRVERGRCSEHRKLVPDAIQAFHNGRQDLEHSTKHKYKRILKLFEAHAGKKAVDEIQPDIIDAFRSIRKVSALTWTTELQILRSFFRFCVGREWTIRNPAALVAMPRNIKPADKEPYSRQQVVKILRACDTFGRQRYERVRARALVLLLRYTALRISDVALLARDRVHNGEIYLRTLKSGKVVRLPVHPELEKALAIVPAPRGAEGEPRYFFWSGNGTNRAAVRDATRTLAAVFKASEVPGAHAHRFRHTLATELLENGATLEDVADVLGNSPNIVRRHYAKWSLRRQQRISKLMRSVFGTRVVHEETQVAN